MKRKIQFFIKCVFDILFFPILALCSLMVRFIPRGSPVRVLLGLASNNNLIYVRNSLNTLGYNAYTIPWIIPKHERGNIDYNTDIEMMFPKLYRNFFGQLILIYFFFIWSIFNFDVYIMPFQNRLLDRTGFLKWFEFQLLHLASKKVILNPYGGDIQYFEIWENSNNKTFQELYKAWKADPYYCLYASKKMIGGNTKYCQKHADSIIVSIDWPDYLEGTHFEYFHMRCIPTSKIVSKITNDKSASNRKIFTIVHATNHEHFKGTKYLREAVFNINKHEEKCKLIILKNTSSQKVFEAIQEADVVFDQILLGAYGRLAIEAMSLAKPVICYLRDDLKELYLNWKECPIINANMVNIQEKILELINMSKQERIEVGNKSKAYIEKYHSPEYVGHKLHTIIQKVLNS